VTLEDTHLAAERQIGIVVLVIFKDNIIEEALGVECLLSADDIEDCKLLG
jgi:hypothetical protein